MPKSHPTGYDSLIAAVEDYLSAPRPITFYGCRPFVPSQDIPIDGPCDLCGGGKPPRADGRAPVASDLLVCGGCHRTSGVNQRRCDAAHERAGRERRARLDNNRLTEGTPIPAIVKAADAAKEAA